MKAKIITKEIMEYFYEKDGLLCWKETVAKCAKKDCVVGNLCKSHGYYVVEIKGSSYLQHRILYQIYHNIILEPNDVIDHIDRNKTNNKKENLRKAPQYQNCMNRKTNKNNKSTGFKNISIKKDANSYRLKIIANNVMYVEYFNINEYTLQEVIEIRNKKLLELHGTFACYD